MSPAPRRRLRGKAAALLLVGGVLTAACGGSTGASDKVVAQDSSTGALPAPGSGPAPPVAFPRRIDRPTKVLVVVEENRSQRSALEQMPYLASLARTYGRTSAYRAVTHPSLPNYLAIFGGSTFGVTTNEGPERNGVRGASIFDTAIAAGHTAKTYVDAMPSNCALAPKAPYAVKHNPWAYFTDPVSRANCRRFDVPAGTPAAGELRRDVDAGTLPTLGLLIPDLCHDGHDCPLETADSYLKSWLTKVLAGPDYRAGRLAVIVTFDEDEGRGDNTVLTTVISPRTRGVVSDEPFTHYSLARYLSQLIRRPPPGRADGAPQLRPAFGI